VSDTLPIRQASVPRLQFRLPPDAARLSRARERIRDYLRQQGVAQEPVEAIVLAIEEACTNAVRHSGVQDDIQVVAQVDSSDVVVAVRDEGRGFDVDAFDPRVVPDPLATGGRGLYLIARLMDEMTLHVNGGLEVRMVKRRAVCRPRAEAALEVGFTEPGSGELSAYRSARLRVFLEEIDEAFLALDWEYRYVFANDVALRMFHTSREELIGRTPFDVWPVMKGSDLETHYREAMELGRPSVFERLSPVTSTWLETRVYPTAAGISVYLREIGERKLVEDRLRGYQLLAQQARDIMLFFSETDGRILEANHAAELAYGCAREQLLRLTIDDLRVADEGSSLRDPTGLGSENGVLFEAVHRRADGSTFPVEVSARGTVDMSGRPVFVSVVRDITDRREAERALREGEERYRRLFTSIDEGFALHEMLYDGGGRPVDYRFLEANPGFGRLTGLAPDDIVGRTVREVLPGIEPYWIDLYGRVVETGRVAHFESEAAELGRWYQGSAYKVGERRFAVIFADVSERRRALAAAEQSGRRAELLARTAGALLSSDDPQRLVEELCREVMKYLDCHVFFNFLVDEQEGRLRLNAYAGIAEEQARAIEWLDYGVAVCGCVARDAQRIVAEEILTTDDDRTDLVRSYGVQAYAAHPLLAQGRVLGTLSFGSRERAHFSEVDLSLMKAVADYVAMAVERQRVADERDVLIDDLQVQDAESEWRRRELQAQSEELQAQSEELRVRNEELQARRIEFERRASLAEALTAIDHVIHSTLDADEVMRRVVVQAREALGVDASVVELRQAERWPVRYAEGLPREALGLPLTPEPIISRRVEERQEPLVLGDVSRSPELRNVLPFGLRSLVAVPLVVREHAFGTLMFLCRARRTFNPMEIEFAQRLATSVSLALENARLYASERNVAAALQQSFVHALPQLRNLELGLVEAPASEPALVGGDFWDVFELPGGQLMVLIGDVAGKGIAAAGLSETVRATMRAFAHVDSSPAFVLRKANQLLLGRGGGDQFVTALVLLLDPETGHVTAASAGHPPPIYVTSSTCALFEVPFGVPLGSFPSEFLTGHLRLSTDDYVVLYTDGLTEARRAGEPFGERRLCETVVALRGRSPQEMAAALSAAAERFAGRLGDDLQVVAFRLR
jgi:PAS domain S-box-containing protein